MTFWPLIYSTNTYLEATVSQALLLVSKKQKPKPHAFHALREFGLVRKGHKSNNCSDICKIPAVVDDVNVRSLVLPGDLFS